MAKGTMFEAITSATAQDLQSAKAICEKNPSMLTNTLFVLCEREENRRKKPAPAKE